MKFTKANYYRNTASNGPVEVVGYVYDYELPNGSSVQMGVNKTDVGTHWQVIDLKSGRTVCPNYDNTRAEAVERAAQYADKYQEMIESEAYNDIVGKFDAALKEHEGRNGEADGKAPRSPEAEEIAAQESTVAAAAAEAQEEKPSISALECVKAVFAGVDGIEVTQKNDLACVWVKGNTKPLRERLIALKFRYSRKKQAWYRAIA